MHPFGGIPICPSCKKAVYAAEQVMGPGRKLYHKPCLACTACRKRLDSFTLLEHDEQPYCKSCHLKNFGTRDLRHANLPYAPPPLDSDSSPVSSPTRRSFSPGPMPKLKPTRSLATSPISPTFRSSPPFTFPGPNNGSATNVSASAEDNGAITEEEAEVQDMLDTKANDDAQLETDNDVSSPSYPSNTGRPGIGTIPRTIPLNLNIGTPKRGYTHHTTQSLGSIDLPLARSNSTAAAAATLLEREGGNLSPLKRTATGTRYGAALGAGGGIGVQLTGSPRKWGAGTPICPRCAKSVYFAEQVKAVGKTWHKGCLRCTECGTTLDSNKLRDHDESPFCVRCYSKLHGPQGGGYALLGKAGG
ncbi:cysteine and glycine-rich protein [Laccaria bicolor S238N-H82]|uniref:Cysteine-rich protein 1 n=1 Tax=Laccaria bicolor (strain S238N-H82 / ATCC MYA-4686) TaxID=486041 RepID=B0D7J3_LACBS|nr:cysteine and glycine-rich protein [Laccaria bicolor S238N-H82]EDR09662.1 cysteine and glycine-rich protein [Laccaria bicolor S238N-H82]|eukprot:XP_001880011.1 cysteine and glycine-rich protein [Laccaria bicolor S238N-H82]